MLRIHMTPTLQASAWCPAVQTGCSGDRSTDAGVSPSTTTSKTQPASRWTERCVDIGVLGLVSLSADLTQTLTDQICAAIEMFLGKLRYSQCGRLLVASLPALLIRFARAIRPWAAVNGGSGHGCAERC